MPDEFYDELASLCAREVFEAKRERDQDRMTAILESVASTLGKTIAIVAGGDPATIDKLVVGCEGRVQEEAVGFAPLIQMQEAAKRNR